PLLVQAALQLPTAERGESARQDQARQQPDKSELHEIAAAGADNAPIAPAGIRAMQKLLIIAFLIVILWNLGAGLYYMMVDKGTTNRTVRSLSWRIGISVVLILIVVA